MTSQGSLVILGKQDTALTSALLAPDSGGG